MRKLLPMLLFVPGLLAEPVYSVTVIPAPSDLAMVTMQGINDSGQVTGFGQLGTIRAFIATPSGSTLIPLPDGITALYGFAINNSGQAACGGRTANNYVRPFICTVSGTMAIPLPNGWVSADAHAINESGTVAGTGYSPINFQQDFIGTISGSTAIPQVGQASAIDSRAINNLGQAVGDLNGGPDTGEVFIGTVSGANPISAPSGWCCAGAFGIDDFGEVAAYGLNAAGYSQAFIATTTSSTPIPFPAGATTVGLTFGAMNDSGAVVGISDRGGWIWTASRGVELLSALVPKGCTSFRASASAVAVSYWLRGLFEGGATQVFWNLRTDRRIAGPSPPPPLNLHGSDLATPFHGFPHGDFIGKLKIAADRYAHGDACDLDAKWLQELR